MTDCQVKGLKSGELETMCNANITNKQYKKFLAKIHPDKNPGCIVLANEAFSKCQNIRESGGKGREQQERERQEREERERQEREERERQERINDFFRKQYKTKSKQEQTQENTRQRAQSDYHDVLIEMDSFLLKQRENMKNLNKKIIDINLQIEEIGEIKNVHSQNIFVRNIDKFLDTIRLNQPKKNYEEIMKIYNNFKTDYVEVFGKINKNYNDIISQSRGMISYLSGIIHKQRENQDIIFGQLNNTITELNKRFNIVNKDLKECHELRKRDDENFLTELHKMLSRETDIMKRNYEQEKIQLKKYYEKECLDYCEQQKSIMMREFENKCNVYCSGELNKLRAICETEKQSIILSCQEELKKLRAICEKEKQNIILACKEQLNKYTKMTDD